MDDATQVLDDLDVIASRPRTFPSPHVPLTEGMATLPTGAHSPPSPVGPPPPPGAAVVHFGPRHSTGTVAEFPDDELDIVPGGPSAVAPAVPSMPARPTGVAPTAEVRLDPTLTVRLPEQTGGDTGDAGTGMTMEPTLVVDHTESPLLTHAAPPPLPEARPLLFAARPVLPRHPSEPVIDVSLDPEHLPSYAALPQASSSTNNDPPTPALEVEVEVEEKFQGGTLRVNNDTLDPDGPLLATPGALAAAAQQYALPLLPKPSPRRIATVSPLDTSILLATLTPAAPESLPATLREHDYVPPGATPAAPVPVSAPRPASPPVDEVPLPPLAPPQPSPPPPASDATTTPPPQGVSGPPSEKEEAARPSPSRRGKAAKAPRKPRVPKPPVPVPQWKVGDHIEARWGGGWYGAFVRRTEVGGTVLQVMWPDGKTDTVEARHTRAPKTKRPVLSPLGTQLEVIGSIDPPSAAPVPAPAPAPAPVSSTQLVLGLLDDEEDGKQRSAIVLHEAHRRNLEDQRRPDQELGQAPTSRQGPEKGRAPSVQLASLPRSGSSGSTRGGRTSCKHQRSTAPSRAGDSATKPLLGDGVLGSSSVTPVRPLLPSTPPPPALTASLQGQLVWVYPADPGLQAVVRAAEGRVLGSATEFLEAATALGAEIAVVVPDSAVAAQAALLDASPGATSPGAVVLGPAGVAASRALVRREYPLLAAVALGFTPLREAWLRAAVRPQHGTLSTRVVGVESEFVATDAKTVSLRARTAAERPLTGHTVAFVAGETPARLAARAAGAVTVPASEPEGASVVFIGAGEALPAAPTQSMRIVDDVWLRDVIASAAHPMARRGSVGSRPPSQLQRVLEDVAEARPPKRSRTPSAPAAPTSAAAPETARDARRPFMRPPPIVKPDTPTQFRSFTRRSLPDASPSPTADHPPPPPLLTATIDTGAMSPPQHASTADALPMDRDLRNTAERRTSSMLNAAAAANPEAAMMVPPSPETPAGLGPAGRDLTETTGGLTRSGPALITASGGRASGMATAGSMVVRGTTVTVGSDFYYAPAADDSDEDGDDTLELVLVAGAAQGGLQAQFYRQGGLRLNRRTRRRFATVQLSPTLRPIDPAGLVVDLPVYVIDEQELAHVYVLPARPSPPADVTPPSHQSRPLSHPQSPPVDTTMKRPRDEDGADDTTHSRRPPRATDVGITPTLLVVPEPPSASRAAVEWIGPATADGERLLYDAARVGQFTIERYSFVRAGAPQGPVVGEVRCLWNGPGGPGIELEVHAAAADTLRPTGELVVVSPLDVTAVVPVDTAQASQSMIWRPVGPSSDMTRIHSGHVNSGAPPPARRLSLSP